MFTVRYRPELASPELLVWLRQFVRYDSDGRCSKWLVQGYPLVPELAAVAGAVAPGIDFSAAALQCYRDGRAVTSCHSDRGGTGFSFILSLGASRTFRIHRGLCGDPTDVVSVECVNGTVLLMDEVFHEDWHHQVVADPGVAEEKLSLVFRTKPGG